MATITYKCDTCKRQVSLVENTESLTVFGHCIITSGCEGTLYRINRNRDVDRNTFPPRRRDLENYTPRRAFYEHTQSILANPWKINHNLGVLPAVIVYITDGSTSKQIQASPDDYTVTVKDKDNIEVLFESKKKGIAHLIARSSVPREVETAAEASELFQVSKDGILTLAVPTQLTNPTVNLSDVDIRINVQVQIPSRKQRVDAETLDDGVNLNSPWVGWDAILIRRRRDFSTKTVNIVDFDAFTEFDKLSDIPNGTTLTITEVDYGSGFQILGSRELFLLLARTPYKSTDKIRDELVDLGELRIAKNNELIVRDGELFVNASNIESVYPSLRRVAIEAVAATPTPTPTPSTTATTSVTPTPTPTSTPTPSTTATTSVTPTPTPTPGTTATTSVTPTPTVTLTETVTPTVTPTVSPSLGVSPTPTPTNTVTPSVTQSVTPTISLTPTQTVTPTISLTPSQTITPSVTPTQTVTPTISLTPTQTITPSVTPSSAAEEKAFISAGMKISGISIVVNTDVERFPFSNPFTTATDVGNLAESRIFATGHSSSTSGYTAAGSGDAVPGANPILNTVTKFPFSAPFGNSTGVGTLSESKSNASGTNSSVGGFVAGGKRTPSIFIRTVLFFPFASPFTNAGNTNDLLQNTADASPHQSSTHGFASGGRSGPSYPDDIKDEVHRYSHSLPSALSTTVGSLVEPTTTSAGLSSSTKGYRAGGFVTSTDSMISAISNFPFSSPFVTTVTIGDLTTPTTAPKGNSGSNDGLVSGGSVNSPTIAVNTDKIESFPFSSPFTNSTVVGTLIIERVNHASHTSK